MSVGNRFLCLNVTRHYSLYIFYIYDAEFAIELHHEHPWHIEVKPTVTHIVVDGSAGTDAEGI